MSYSLDEDKRVTYFGDWKVRTFTMDVDNYDDDGSSDGEAFTPSDAGMHRFRHVHADVIGAGSATTGMLGSVAHYDEDTQAIRLYHSGGADDEMAEMSSNADEGALVRITAIGK